MGMYQYSNTHGDQVGYITVTNLLFEYLLLFDCRQIHLECFMAMVQWNFDIMSTYFNPFLPEDEDEEKEQIDAERKKETEDNTYWTQGLDEQDDDAEFSLNALDFEVGSDGPEGSEVWEGEEFIGNTH